MFPSPPSRPRRARPPACAGEAARAGISGGACPPYGRPPAPARAGGSARLGRGADLSPAPARPPAQRASNSSLARENEMYRRHLERLDPDGLDPRSVAPKPQSRRARKAKDSSKREEGVEALSTQEKYDVAAAEVELLQGLVAAVHQQSEKENDYLSTLQEEASMRIAEVKKDTYEFKRDIVLGAENARTGQVDSERMLRHMEDHLKDRDAQIEKMALKNNNIKSQIQKAEQQLHQREEMGDVLSVIDFDQLKIENHQFLEKIEERNNELLRLKLTTGKTVQLLNGLKTSLAAHTDKSAFLQREIAERREQLARFRADAEEVTKEKEREAKRNKGMKQEQSNSELPNVMDYIKLKAEVSDLRKKKGDWERKIEIAQMESKCTGKQKSARG